MGSKFLKLAFVCSLAVSGCSTTGTQDDAPPPLDASVMDGPAQPSRFDMAALQAILRGPGAPSGVQGEFADTCDEDFKKLTAITHQKDELEKGAVELVTDDKTNMHWCFYAKIARLQEVLQSDATWSQRQKKVLESFEFLSPVANAFFSTQHDTHYLQWAAQYYSKVSEWVFFKKLEPTPESTARLTNAAHEETHPNPNSNPESSLGSVFAKYGITITHKTAAVSSTLPAEPTIGGMMTSEEPMRAPAPRAPASIAKTPVPYFPPASKTVVAPANAPLEFGN